MAGVAPKLTLAMLRPRRSEIADLSHSSWSPELGLPDAE
jgi:hypothetical protein